MSNAVELGSCEAIISGISTKIDGSIKLTLEVNPNDEELISRLIKRFAQNKKLVQIGLIGIDHE